MKIKSSWHRLLLVLLSIVLLSLGWLGISGLSLLVALVPLLLISQEYSDSRRDWWRMCGWAALTFLGWNAATIWWVWIATPAGPITAGIVGTFYNLCAFMTYHYTSKRGSRALAYTLLISIWIATEWAYNSAEVMTFPWLLLGHGFSHDIWAVQWYEYTGIFGGSLWALCANIAVFDTLRAPSRKGILRTATIVIAPLIISLVIYFGYTPSQRTTTISVVQPNIPCYEEERIAQGVTDPTDDIIELMADIPQNSSFAILPESALAYMPIFGSVDESKMEFYAPMLSQLHGGNSNTKLIAGASTMRSYGDKPATETARKSEGYGYYDLFNSALLINEGGEVEQVYHKQKLVIGVEATPFREVFDNLEIDLGGVSGQLGWGERHLVFENGETKIGPAICYEGLYGNHFAGFVREGAEVMAVISNDGWWGNTPGHKRLFDFCRLRAIETRRSIARSANTGISGFISPRGDIVGETLDWQERGIKTQSIELRNDITFYVLYGDVIARIATLIALLAALYFVAYQAKRRNQLID